MLVLFYLLGSTAAGWWLMRRFAIEWSWWVEAACAVVLGQLIGSWTSLVLALALPSSQLAVIISLILLVFPFIWAVRELWRTRETWQDLYAIPLLTSLCLLVPVLFAFWLHAPYLNEMGGFSTHGYTWGDLPLHMTLASFFQNQTHLSLELPFLPNTPLTYPFLMDWQTSLMLRLGSSWAIAVAVPGALLGLGSFVLSWELARLLLKSARAAAIHLFLFLGLGSVGGMLLLLQTYLGQGMFWYMDVSNQVEKGLPFANPVTSHFFPQRSFLFGFAVIMALFVIGRELWQKHKWSQVPLWGGLVGLLPFVHVHSGLIALGWYYLLLLIIATNHPTARRWCAYGALIALAGAFPQLWWLFHVPHAGGMAKLGWMWNGEGSLTQFWFDQLGLLFVFIPAGLWALRKRLNDPWVASGIVAGFFLFVVGNLYLFHPNPFDNLKFMLYGFWILLLPAAFLLSSISRSRFKWTVPLFLFCMTFVGYQTIVRDLIPATGSELFSSDDIQAAAELQGIIPADALVATLGRHNSMITALMGRRILAGYSGWLWSYGLSYQDEASAETTILQAEDNGELIRRYGVDYIAVSTRDATEGEANMRALSQKYELLYQAHDWTVFRATEN